MEALINYIRAGGLFMYPILACSFWALTLLIERAVFYFQTASLLTRQKTEVTEALAEGGLEKLGEIIKTPKGIINNVLLTVLNAGTTDPARIEEKMEVVLLKQLPPYGRYLNLLATLSGLMPVLGLLGTVTGMIATFKVIALQGTGDAQAMADGISEALITTQAGLIAAVPIILGHILLVNRLKKITDTTHEICAHCIDYLKDTHVK